MRKLLLLLALIATIGVVETKAQVYTYRTTGYAYKKVNSYGNWTQWSDWQDSDMRVVINFNTDVITIYSPKTQIYKVTEHLRNFTDSSGGSQVEFAAVDEDGLRCHIRLRIETNGNSQIYCEWSNLIHVYNVRRTN